MKKIIIWCVVLAGCFLSFGEISKNELKEYSSVIDVDGVRDKTKEHGDEKYEELVIEFSGGDDEDDYKLLEKVRIRFLLEITDKKTKQTYYVEKEQPHGVIKEDGRSYEGYTGEGYWTLSVPYQSRFKRLEISAYALQYGVMDGSVFVPFIEEYDGVKTYEELLERTTAKFPFDAELDRTIYVEEVDR